MFYPFMFKPCKIYLKDRHSLLTIILKHCHLLHFVTFVTFCQSLHSKQPILILPRYSSVPLKWFKVASVLLLN